MQKRAVAIADVSGAFLKTEMPENNEDVTVVFEGKMVELLLKTDPSYEKYVHITKAGKKILYVRLKRLCMDVFERQDFFMIISPVNLKA